MSTSFEPGAAPAGFIPLCVPHIRGPAAWKYVKECLDTEWVSSVGPFVERFEQMVAAAAGTRYAVATVTGTAALHTALLVAGVLPDEEVLVPSLTFIASANAIRYVGAYPVFIDCEPVHAQMDPRQVVAFLDSACEWRGGGLHNKATGRRVKAIVPVHVLGHPVDMQPILEAARKYGLMVVEDAAEALGARYRDRQGRELKVGQLGDMGCLSFNGNKIITTGGGGMLVTDNPHLAERARYLTTQAKDDPLEYIHNEMGYNYRLTNLQAALGVAQMEVLDDHVAQKRRIAQRYREAFAACPGIHSLAEADWAFSTHWLATVLIDERTCGLGSRDMLRHLTAQRIQSRPLWQPLHLSPSFKNLPPRQCPVAEQLSHTALSLPCSVGLAMDQQERVIEVVTACLKGRSKAKLAG
ncbi:MAG TPA: LegC family aminotransferase [Gemmataceae bacterium]|nr:LegC family aminotransferase [Gemmataceae bacterium]